MASAGAPTKAGRLVELQRIFATRPIRGFRTAEIAERLGAAPQRTGVATDRMALGNFLLSFDENTRVPAR